MVPARSLPRRMQHLNLWFKGRWNCGWSVGLYQSEGRLVSKKYIYKYILIYWNTISTSEIVEIQSNYWKWLIRWKVFGWLLYYWYQSYWKTGTGRFWKWCHLLLKKVGFLKSKLCGITDHPFFSLIVKETSSFWFRAHFPLNHDWRSLHVVNYHWIGSNSEVLKLFQDELSRLVLQVDF